MRILKLIKEYVVALMTVLDAYRQRCEASHSRINE
jgi:hypothetical protein